MENKSMTEYLAAAIRGYNEDKSSEEKFMAAFFSLIDLAESGEEIGLLCLDAHDGISPPFIGETKDGEKLLTVSLDGFGNDVYGAHLEKYKLKEITALCLKNKYGIIVRLSDGNYFILNEANTEALGEHLSIKIKA